MLTGCMQSRSDLVRAKNIPDLIFNILFVVSYHNMFAYVVLGADDPDEQLASACNALLISALAFDAAWFAITKSFWLISIFHFSL